MSDPTFTLSTAERDGFTVLELGGELDLFAAPRLAAALDAVCGAEQRIVVDLRGLEFIDSTGLALILRYHQRATDGHFAFVVVRGPAPVDRVFRVTRADTLLEMLDVPPSS